jgi:hypothetical protein
MENLRYLTLGSVPGGHRWSEYPGTGWGNVVKGCVVDLQQDGWEEDDGFASDESDADEDGDEFYGEDENDELEGQD